jgi:hypothetical protein
MLCTLALVTPLSQTGRILKHSHLTSPGLKLSVKSGIEYDKQQELVKQMEQLGSGR